MKALFATLLFTALAAAPGVCADDGWISMRKMVLLGMLAEVRRFAREQYGIDTEASWLPAEKDLNVLLVSSGGEYVLKLAAPETPLEELDFQIRTMRTRRTGSRVIFARI